MAKRVTEVLSIVGGLIGVVYALGFLTLAGHHRVLGLPIRSTDPVALLGAASEFLVRGSLVLVLRVFESALPGRIGFTVVLVLIFLGGLTVGVAWSRQGWRPGKFLHSASAAVMDLRVVWLARGIVTLCLLLLLFQSWHVAANVVPVGAVTSLLLGRSDASPFLGATKTYFESRWTEVQKDLLGNGQHSNTRNLSRRYVLHVVVATSTCGIAIGLWSVARRMRESRLQWLAAIPLAAGLTLVAVVTPLFYGALVKSYRYPLVQVISTSGLEDHDDLRSEFRQTLFESRFLLDETGENLYLFDDLGAILVLKRDEVALVKIVAEDFIFRTQNRGGP